MEAATKAVAKLLGKRVGSKAVSALIGATTGAAAGSGGGPLGMVIGALIGLAVGILTDEALLKLEEALDRDKFRQEIISSLEELRQEYKEMIRASLEGPTDYYSTWR